MPAQRPPLVTLLRAITLIVAAASGMLVFAQYFFPSATLNRLTQPLLQTVVYLTGAALLYAILNLLGSHISKWRDAAHNGRDKLLSGVLLAAFLLTFVAGLLPSGFEYGLGLQIYDWIISPGMAALFALLPVFLAYALFRHLHVRDAGMVLFVVGLLAVLAGQTPLLAARFPVLAALRHSLLIGPAAAAFRGVLIGLAMGIILTVFSRLRLES